MDVDRIPLLQCRHCKGSFEDDPQFSRLSHHNLDLLRSNLAPDYDQRLAIGEDIKKAEEITVTLHGDIVQAQARFAQLIAQRSLMERIGYWLTWKKIAPLTCPSCRKPFLKKSIHRWPFSNPKNPLSKTMDIQQTREYLIRLNSMRLSITAVCQEHKSFLAPVRNLPIELLQTIFLHFRKCINIPRGSKHENQWILLQVCHLWRMVALSLPQLWSDIAILNYFQQDSEKERASDCLDLVLRRSGHHPLKFHILVLLPEDLSNSKIYNMFLSQSFRWEFIFLKMPQLKLDDFSSVKGKIPLLQSLTIHSNQTPLTQRMDFFQNAPNLRHVDIEELEIASFVPLLPWSQLTKFSIAPQPPFEEIYGIMGQLTNLVHLNIVSSQLQLEAPTSQQTNYLHIPSVRRLTLKLQCYYGQGSTFLERLVFPELEELELRVMVPATYRSLLRLLERSSCSLRRFSYRNHIRNDITILSDIASNIPSVTDLELYFTPPEYPSFFGYLAAEDEDGKETMRLPNLSSLAINLLPQSEYPPLLDAIKSRIQKDPSRQLDTLKITYDDCTYWQATSPSFAEREKVSKQFWEEARVRVEWCS